MRADRLLDMMLLLQKRGKMRTDDLAGELGVSKRTVLRDLDALSLAGVPIYTESGHGGGVALQDDYRTTLSGLKSKEVGTLLLSDNERVLSQIGLGDSARHSFDKLLGSVPAQHRPVVEQLRGRLLIDPTWWFESDSVPRYLEDLQRAVFEDLYVETRYEGWEGRISERRLAPYGLVAKSSTWYLVAKSAEEFRTFRVSRFLSLTVLDEHHPRDRDFDLPAHWRDYEAKFTKRSADYVFTMRVHENGIAYLTRMVSGQYTLVDGPDREGWSTMKFTIDSVDFAVMLAFGLGQSGVVLDPPELRTRVEAAAQSVLRGLRESEENRLGN